MGFNFWPFEISRESNVVENSRLLVHSWSLLLLVVVLHSHVQGRNSQQDVTAGHGVQVHSLFLRGVFGLAV